MINWNKVRHFVHRRTHFCTAVVEESSGIRVFPIGSLYIHPDGSASYFELFARPAEEGARVTFLAVDMGVLFWLSSLLLGRFSHPPALRLQGVLGTRRRPTEREERGWRRRVGWLLKTPGGRALWSGPAFTRELEFQNVQPVNLGRMTNALKNWERVA